MALILLSGVAASMLAACLVLHFKEDRPSASTADLARLSAKDALTTALGSRDYILLTTGFFVCGIQIVFIGTHLPTYLRDAGLSAEVASWSLAVVGLFNIIGSFAAGWLGSFMSKKKAVGLVLSGAFYFHGAIYRPAPDAADGHFIRLYYGAVMAGDCPANKRADSGVFWSLPFYPCFTGLRFYHIRSARLSGHGWADAFMICWAAMR